MIRRLFVFAVLWILGLPVWAQESEEILGRIDAFRVPYETFLLKLKITSFVDDAVNEVGWFDAYIDGEDKSLVIAKEYRTQDMKILYVDENMWVHLPGSQRQSISVARHARATAGTPQGAATRAARYPC